MGHMPAIPPSTRGPVTLRLLDHAEKHWPQLENVQVTCRATFAYVAGVLPGGDTIPLSRLRHGGSAHSFGFAIYPAAHGRHEDAALLTGLPAGTRRKHSTPPAPSTSPESATNRFLTPDELTGPPP
jgi:hypothetical protein